jgi:hypothetical protein
MFVNSNYSGDQNDWLFSSSGDSEILEQTPREPPANNAENIETPGINLVENIGILITILILAVVQAIVLFSLYFDYFD